MLCIFVSLNSHSNGANLLCSSCFIDEETKDLDVKRFAKFCNEGIAGPGFEPRSAGIWYPCEVFLWLAGLDQAPG